MPDWQITDEMVAFHDEAAGAMNALSKQLQGTEASERLSRTVAKVTGLIAQRYGVLIDGDSALTLPGVKSEVMGAGAIDVETLLFAAQQKIAKVAFHTAKGADSESQSSETLPANFETMSPSAKINWARNNGHS